MVRQPPCAGDVRGEQLSVFDVEILAHPLKISQVRVENFLHTPEAISTLELFRLICRICVLYSPQQSLGKLPKVPVSLRSPAAQNIEQVLLLII